MILFYDLLLEYPEWFTKKGPLDKKRIIEENIRVQLGQFDKEGRPIFIAKMGKVNKIPR